MNRNKKSTAFLFFALLIAAYNGQSQFLPLNSSGKCEMAEIVIAEGFPKSTLHSNEVKWLKGLIRLEGTLSSIEIDSLQGKVSADFELPVYAQSGILRKLVGSITYHINVESKDSKYRYAFTDFVFHYYAQDRNYKMVKTGNTRPLNEPVAHGWQKLWTEHRRTIYSRVSSQIADLKTKIVEVSKPVDAKIEKKPIDW